MKLNDINDAIAIWGPATKEALADIESKGDLIIVPENRPYLLGLNHNLPLLNEVGAKFVYCVDNALGLLFYKNKIKRVKIFTSKIEKEKAIGVTGSNYIYLLSKLHKVDIEFLPAGKFDKRNCDKDASTLGGKEFITIKDKNNYLIETDDEEIKLEE